MHTFVMLKLVGQTFGKMWFVWGSKMCKSFDTIEIYLL